KARQDGVIAKPVESAVKVTASGDTYKLLKAHEDELASLFIVSQAELVEGDGETVAEVSPAVGEKCDRCRLVSETVGHCGDHPTLCARCAEIVKNL
ncbi:MAG: isoleucine--tRNA ligase, partial [Abditibacteriota bacterium]|nr:isoleucine--tRNA ligase [Abditibacteriota bacterium]